jgi:hypothetical protein
MVRLQLNLFSKRTGAFLFRTFGGFLLVPTTQIYCRSGAVTHITNIYRHYTASYSYVGGYYGGCSETAMKKALVENGPLAVSFEVIVNYIFCRQWVKMWAGNTWPDFS